LSVDLYETRKKTKVGFVLPTSTSGAHLVKEQASSYSRMAYTVTARYELEFEFDIPEGVDLDQMERYGDSDDPNVDKWDISYFDSHWFHIPKLFIYYKDGREVSIEGFLRSDGSAVEIDI